ncbi:hypothetical protein [Leisingera sp. ANG-M1]|nr:hypothetical protein [Leisingera sp. ANG-M1]
MLNTLISAFLDYLPGAAPIAMIAGLTFLKLLPYIRTNRERRQRQEEMD